MFTIQHKKSGKYISSLFSDKIKDTFQATHISMAYEWNSKEACQLVAWGINIKAGDNITIIVEI